MKKINEELKNLINHIQQAIDYGFAWPSEKWIIKQIFSELNEIQEVIDNKDTKERLRDEIGDLLHACCSLIHSLDLDSKLNNEELLKPCIQTDLDNISDYVKNMFSEFDNMQNGYQSKENYLQIIFSSIQNLCNLTQINLLEIIENADMKFMTRFNIVKDLINKDYNLNSGETLTAQELVDLWNRAKKVANLTPSNLNQSNIKR